MHWTSGTIPRGFRNTPYLQYPEITEGSTFAERSNFINSDQ